MEGPPRILVASPSGRIVVPALAALIPDATVRVALDPDSVRREITSRVRFDVVVADLVWNQPTLEYTFDGLDVLTALQEADRTAPVVMALQGTSFEQDHLEEARLRREVAYIYDKSSNSETLFNVIRNAAIGRRRSPIPSAPPNRPPLYELFRGRRGQTAGRLAAAIAAGRATDAATLAAATGVALNTASKVTTHYLGPIIQQRGEHDADLPMTLGAVYRWCGLHARYLVSWRRRHGHSSFIVAH